MFETSATALCGTTGIYIYILYIYSYTTLLHVSTLELIQMNCVTMVTTTGEASSDASGDEVHSVSVFLSFQPANMGR